MTDEQYKQEWLNGMHQSDYNACRFSDDKIQFAKNWISSKFKYINIDNPQNIVDRINYYKIFDKDIRKEYWSDKISALYNLRDLNLNELIIEPVFFSRCYFTEQDYNSLPNGKYIIKCNHGSGWNIKFEKKPGNNPKYIIDKIKEWYNLNYAYVAGYEWQYEHIIPGVIVQPDLGDLLNWSFWCENGEIKYVQVYKKLGKNYEEFLYWCDENGNKTDIYLNHLHMLDHLPDSKKIILNKLKPYAKKLAQDFKFVRVDLYYINEQPKFGELTFTPCSGSLQIYNY